MFVQVGGLKMPERIYNIQEVADILGLYKGTIINYEKKHIFPKAKRNPINNYREYTGEDLEKLKRILKRGR
jgi:DNA-binding transcriptional MerR regulator